MESRERNKLFKFEEFGEHYERKIIQELETKSVQNTSQSNDYDLLKKGIFILLISMPLFYAYNSPCFTLNLAKPLKANFVELSNNLTPFEGNLKPNNALKNAKYLAKGKLRGPEQIVFSRDGSLYTGLMNGDIVRVNELDQSVTKIVKIGNEENETLCNDALYSNSKCGRPLGLRIKENSNYLYVADAYSGIYKVDLSNNKKYLVLSSSDKRFGDAPLLMTNDLDLDQDVIYFIDSSYEREVNEALEEHLEALPRGRLYSYNQKLDKLELLLSNLYFPNGLQLSPNKDFILINENSMARIIKYHLTGELKGKKEIFADLPGFSDNLRLTEQNTLLVPFVLVRNSPYSSVLDIFGKYPLIRTLLGFVLNWRYIGLKTDLVPKYGLVIEYDLNGKILKSWHDTSGKVVPSSSSAILHKKKLYLGSFYLDFVSVIDY